MIRLAVQGKMVRFRFKVVLLLLFSVFCCVCGLKDEKAWAAGYNCGNVGEKVNDAIYFACHNVWPQGTLWISSDKSTTSVSTQVKVDDWRGNKLVDIYLHGAVFGGSGRATYIKLVKGKNKIIGTAANYKEYTPLKNVPAAMDRASNNGIDSIKSAVVGIQLNVKSLINIEGEPTRSETKNGVNKVTYQVPIQAFRCYEGQVPHKDNEHCFSSKSTMKVIIKTVRLKGIARDESGTLLGNNPETEVGSVGDDLGLRAKKIEGYTLLGWSSAKNGPVNMCENMDTCVVKNVTQNKTIYAVYRKNESITLSGIAVDSNNRKPLGSQFNPNPC